MREQELQDHIEGLVARGELVDALDWDLVHQISLDRRQNHDRLLLLDNLVLHRAAEAALLVRARLTGLVPVSKNNRSISLDRSELLFVDLLYTSPATGTVVVVEIKRARTTARETVTELLGYEQEVRNHLPFAARSDICFVVVSTDYSTLLEHSLASLISWHGLNILCIEVDEALRLSVRLPVGWTSFGQDVIPSEHIDTVSLTFTPHDTGGRPSDIGVLLNSAMDLIARDADRSGITGFGIVWEDVRYLWESQRPAGMTVARVNPARFLTDTRAARYLVGPHRSPLHQHVADLDRDGKWRPSSPELDAASRYLARLGTVEWHRSGTWRDIRRDARHRHPETTLDTYAVPVIFNTWGLIGDYVRELLGNPGRMADTAGVFRNQVIEIRGPEFGLKVVDTIAPGEKITLFGARWWSSLGFRLSRLRTYAAAHQVKTDMVTRDRLRPLLAWARADLQSPLSELDIAIDLAEIDEPLPEIVLGSGPDEAPLEQPDAIYALVCWIADRLIGDRSALHRTLFEVAFHTGQALDDGVFAIAPDIDLDDTIGHAIDHAHGMLEVAIHLAPQRPGAYAGLIDHFTRAFGLGCGPETAPDELEELVRRIPVETLFDEYLAAVPAALDIAVAPMTFGAARTKFVIPAEAIVVLRHRILRLRDQGRPAGIYMDPTGEYGMVILEQEDAAIFRELRDDDVIVRTSYSDGSESHQLTTWAQLAKKQDS